MRRCVALIFLATIGLPMMGLVWCPPSLGGPQPQSNATSPSAEQQRAVVAQYCVSCHNERTKTAGLMCDKMDFTNVSAGAEIWEKAVRKLRVGMMPPQGAPQPDEATRQGLVSWLTTELDRAAGTRPNPGRPLLHRL